MPYDEFFCMDLSRGTKLACEMIGSNGQLLFQLQKGCIEYFEKNKESMFINDFSIDNFYSYAFREILNRLQYYNSPSYIEFKFRFKWDDDKEYVYLKFNPIGNWQNELMSEIVKLYKLEDFHYQDSTDPPKNISYNDYEKRREVWKKLTNNKWAFDNWYIGEFMDSTILYNHIRKYEYTGCDGGPYHHLAYKFTPASLRDIKLKSII